MFRISILFVEDQASPLNTNSGYQELQQQPGDTWLCREIGRASQDEAVQERGCDRLQCSLDYLI